VTLFLLGRCRRCWGIKEKLNPFLVVRAHSESRFFLYTKGCAGVRAADKPRPGMGKGAKGGQGRVVSTFQHRVGVKAKLPDIHCNSAFVSVNTVV
jgi:hypothetical protein